MSAVARRDSILPPEALTLPSAFMLASSRGKLIVPRHIVALERKLLLAMARGDRMVTVEAPVRSGKSVYVDHHLTSWFLGTFPQKNVGIVSHEQGFASSWGAKARDTLIEYGSSFGVQVHKDFRARSWWELEHHGGSMRSFGIKAGGMTGRGFDLLIFDDLIKSAADADSEVVREAQWEFLTGTAISRLEPGSLLIVMSARWHEDDLIGRIHERRPGWMERIRMPAIAEAPDDEFPEPDLLGREPGEALWPQRWPLWRLAKRRVDQGEYYFNANYQQRPSPPLGTVFHRDWWETWHDLPPQFDIQLWSWDMAFKDTATSSFVVGQCWAKRGANFYLLHQVRGQWDYPETKRQLVAAISLPEYEGARSTVLVEDKANGTAIIADLKTSVPGLIPVSVPQDSKEARARSVSGYVEAHNVYLPANVAWREPFIDELAKFPKGAHNDQVDTLSQGMRELIKRSGGSVVTQIGQNLPPRG